MKNTEELILVNVDTNEIEDKIRRKKGEEINFYTKKKLTPKQRAFLNQKNELTKHSKTLGGYIHMYFVSNEVLFNELNIERANISRLIYLSTHIDYNDREANLLIKYTKNNKIEPMVRTDIKKILGLGDTAFKSFMSDMKNNGLVYEVEGKFYINPEYFSKGENNIKDKQYTRIYINTTRLLYENCTSKQHKQLSYVFQLVPYLNYETNVICHNSSETNKEMNFKEVAELVGIDISTKQNINKFKKELYKFSVRYGKSEYYLFKGIIEESKKGKKEYFIVNPFIIYGGKEYEDVKKIVSKLHFQD